MNPHECSVTWQVVRSEFDQMMLENARGKGVGGLGGCERHGCDAGGGGESHESAAGRSGQWWVSAAAASGTVKQTSRAKVVIDATGTQRAAGEEAGAAQERPEAAQGVVLRTLQGGAARQRARLRGRRWFCPRKDNDGWFWYIPLQDDMVSIGVVGDIDRLGAQNKGKTPEQILEEEIKNCHGLDDRMDEGGAGVAGARAVGFLVPRDAVRGRGLGADRRRVRVFGSDVFRPAFSWR